MNKPTNLDELEQFKNIFGDCGELNKSQLRKFKRQERAKARKQKVSYWLDKHFPLPMKG